MIRCDSGTDSIVWMREVLDIVLYIVLYIQKSISDLNLICVGM